jgi:hypothetical protein
MSVALCAHRFPNASFCQRRAREGSRFCGYHRADENLTSFPEQPGVNPLDRLTEISDVFAVVRETVNAARLGRMSPAQVYAVCAAIHLWLKLERELGYHDRQDALERQYVSSVLDAEASQAESADDAPPTLSHPQPDEGFIEPSAADHSSEVKSPSASGDSPARNAAAAPALAPRGAAAPPSAKLRPRHSGQSAKPGVSAAPAPLTGEALTRAVIESALAPLRGNGRKRRAPA